MADKRIRKPRKKVCYFTENNISYIDFRNVDVLKKFIGETGKILPRRFTGTKSYYQKHLALAIKRARHMALLPFVDEK
jgi:small subunit ribosomal protein S18